MPSFDYNTLAEKHFAFKYSGAQTITTESEFRSIFLDRSEAKDYFFESAIFRGVKESKWKLFSTCQRAFLSGKVAGENQSSFIEREIENVKDAIGGLLPKYYNELGVPVTDFIYLSFLQHYGAPTTLIDFTRDVWTALWMSVSDIKYPSISTNDIDNYFSLYWIDKEEQEKIKSMLEIYRSGYLEHIVEYTKDAYIDDSDSKSKFTIQHELRDIINAKKSIIDYTLNFIKWDNSLKSCLAGTYLGLIYTSNASRHDRRYSLEQISDSMNNAADTLMKYMSASALKAFKNIVKYLFNEVVKIANLNLVAQEGCFIHYLPKSYTTPLEEDSAMNGIIHCVDIHKSLAPFILKELEKKGICKSSMFPNTEEMARYAFQNSQSLH